MVYAVLMLAIFSLLLQFYLHSQLSEARLALASQEGTDAYLMAEWTADIACQEKQKKMQDREVSAESQERLEEKEGEVRKKEQPKSKGMTTKELKKNSEVQGTVQFSQGQSHYQSENDFVRVRVTTLAGHDFSYSFPLSSEK
ncbi:hypothetical protein GGG87_02360 [Streptococcus sp. zg-86]|uniref:Competence protein ComGG n=1 Tax=Streptococcus zhangguiae TaxID=2664091 RepID=A0A6I4RG54_9STRE|nr:MULTISPECIES: competence type IV pilus minor pilin ComGG [unclassified Streptococcus]MTB63855.1 hypothetical protein [Streptococcus sp. zg-86]MTB90165.1 hypothetical protein [Streptococcus sp. zg-36]MWV55837.1 hypothetical protein [Streptococcus sp. zg-70]QTH47881.1 hypothetical protein J5M87_00640 [Streptococcus sp. zg-86]